MTPETTLFTARDRDVLRDLARRKAQIAADPVNQERRDAWYALDEGRPTRPMILADVICVLEETIPSDSLRCSSDAAREIERNLRKSIFEFESVRDDQVQTADYRINWPITVSDFGVTTTQHYADNDGHLWSHVAEALPRSPSRRAPVTVKRRDGLSSSNRAASAWVSPHVLISVPSG